MALTIEELRKARDRNSQKSGSLSVDDLKKARASNVQQTEDVPLADVPLTALKNVPGSALELGKNIITPLLKPVQTAKDIYSLGESIVGVIQPGEQGNEETARAVGQFLANRYGSLNAIKNTFANDPVGILADVSILFTGGGSLAARAPGIAGKVGQGVKTVGQTIDPITQTGRLVGNVGGKISSNLMGLGTGAGKEGYKVAYAAGKAGGGNQKTFAENLRGNVPVEDVVPRAFDAIRDMSKAKSKAYTQGMGAVKAAKTKVDFNGIEKAYQNVLDDFTIKTEQGNILKGGKDLQKKFDEINELITTWKNNPELHLAENVDALKQAVDTLWKPGKDSVIVTKVRQAIKDEIVKQVPKYADTMKAYEEAISLEKKIMSELSLKKNAAAGTTLRKLQSVMRNNVNTNYGNRLEMLKTLDPELLPALAGQALNTWTPRGLQSLTATGSGLAGIATSNPAFFAALPLQSPRLMGELALKSGQASRMLGGAPQAAQTARIAGLLEEQIEEDARQSLLNRFGN